MYHLPCSSVPLKYDNSQSQLTDLSWTAYFEGKWLNGVVIYSFFFFLFVTGHRFAAVFFFLF